jgi:hypothetical protein
MGNLERGGRQSTSLRRVDPAASIANRESAGRVLLMRFGHLFSRYRTVSRWSGLLAAIAMALLTLAASAQMVGSEKGKRHRDTQKTEDQAKKRKVDEKAYEDALKSIPPSSEKSDPWKSMR